MNQTSIGVRTKFWYGVGQVSEGVKNYAFQLMLLYYYNQVLGVSASLVGLVLLLALLFDAVTDPLIGSLSDSLRSRWGRRHGFMYAAAAPMGVAFYFTFAPPSSLGQQGLLLWLLFWSVAARAAMTLYHVPHMALGAELSTDYHERTSVVAYRVFFGYFGAVLLVVLSRAVFLPATSVYPVGQSNPAGYAPMGLWMGLLIAVVIFVSAYGTHDRIPYLEQAAAGSRFSLRGLLRDMVEALRNRSFRAFFIGLLLYTVGRGVDLALWMYVGTFFFGLGTNTQLVPLCGIIGVLVGTPVWARVRMDKRQMFIWGISGYAFLTIAMPMAKLLDLLPAVDSGAYLPLILLNAFIAAMFGAGPLLAGSSMVADISDEHELLTGRRQEGIFFGALAFSLKAASGAGNWLGAVALSAIAFPTKVRDPSSVDPDTVVDLALVYGPGVLVITVLGIMFMRGYRLTSVRHAEIRRELVERRSAKQVVATPVAPPPAGAAAELG